MIVPPKVAEFFKKNPEVEKDFLDFPLIYYGEIIRYPKQAWIIREWLKKKPKICVITGWKRVSKTSIATYLMSCWAYGYIRARWPGARAMDINSNYLFDRYIHGEKVAVVGGKSMDHVENVLLKEYREMIPPSYVKEWMPKTKHSLKLVNGAQINVRTYDQDIESWKSGKAQFIHLDEEPPYNVAMECMERMRTEKGKMIITVALDDAEASWLPNACLHPMKVFGTDSFMHFKLGVEDVPDEIYPREEKENVFRQYDDTPMRMAVRKGDWAFVSGKWWKEFDVNKHVIEPFKIPDHWLKWRFMDAGMAAPAACLWVAMHPQGDIFFYREFYKAGLVIDARCEEVIRMSGNNRQKESGVWVEKETSERYVLTQLDHHEFKRDPVSGDSLDYHYVTSGLTVQPSTTMGQESRREIVNKWLKIDPNKKHFITKEKGAPRVYVFNTCVNLIFEAQTKIVKREGSDRSGISERKIDNRNDHLLDCGEYACCELEFWQKDKNYEDNDQ